MASSYLKKIWHHHDQEGTWYHFPIYRVMISTFFDDVMPGCFDIICSLPTENKLWNHPILMICMIRRQVAFEQIITIAKGFSNSCPSVESVSFHQSSSLGCVPFINNASRQFFLNKWSFLWSSFQRFDKSLVCRRFFYAYLMSNRLKSLNNPTLLLDYSHTVPLKWPPISELRLDHLVV